MNALPATIPLRSSAFDRLPPARRARPMLSEGMISAGLHAALVLLLIVTVTHKKPHDVTTPGSVAVVFEGGAKQSTRQSQESRHSSPTSRPDAQETEAAPLGARASRPSPAHLPARPSQAAPSQAAPTPPAPALPVAPGGLLPEARPHPMRPPLPRAAASPFATLSQPMTYSLEGHPPPPASEGHLKRGINLAMAPNDQNSNIMTRYAEARRRLGEDWWNAFTEFVEEHKYYPMRAAERGEDGRAVLQLRIARDGQVKSVKLLVSSGSERLDDAWISEFRGAKVPPFPPGTVENEITFPASMDYILLHE